MRLYIKVLCKWVEISDCIARLAMTMKNSLLLTIACAMLTASAHAITVTTNVAYNSQGGTGTVLDVYLPDQAPPFALPTIVNIHGGGFVGGDKSQVSAFCAQLARRGHPVVNINYTLATDEAAGHPQAVRDVKAAIRWARTAGVTEFRLPRNIILVGQSAGGTLAMLAAASNGVAAFNPQGMPPIGGYGVQGCVSMWGLSDMIWQVETVGQSQNLEDYFGAPLTPATMPLYASGSAVSFAGSCDPPFAFFHGSEDELVPFQQSIFMAEALRPFGIYAEVNIRPGAGHGFEDFGGQVVMADQVALAIGDLRESRNPADFNRDGGVDGSDVAAFFTAWEAGDGDSDINGDGAVDGEDVEAFIVTWENGGC